MFEWDEDKRLKNLAKHELDFVAARLLFDGRETVTTMPPHSAEARYVTTTLNDGKFCTVVWTWRDETRRINSFRRARHGEERTYRQLHG